MKTQITSALLATALATVIGCASPRKGPAYGLQKEFRRQLAESTPVREWGYAVQELRFSMDYQRALVVFVRNGVPGNEPDKTPSQLDAKLDHDGFRRYIGNAYRGRTGPSGLTDGKTGESIPATWQETSVIKIILPAKE